MFAKRLLTIFLLVTLLHVASAQQAHAYLDPGTGSYIFQILIAAVVGVGFLVRIYWGKIKGLFTRHTPEDAVESKEDENA